LATVGDLIETMGESATLHTRVLGARNAVTKQPAVTYTDTTIKILMDDTATSERYESAGRITEKQYTGYVNADIAVAHLYRVTVQAIIYEVRSTPTIEYLEGTASFKKLAMTRVS